MTQIRDNCISRVMKNTASWTEHQEGTEEPDNKLTDLCTSTLGTRRSTRTQQESGFECWWEIHTNN